MELINKYFPDLGEEKLLKIQRFQELFLDWNNKINLISRKDMDRLEERHVLHSLSLAKFIQFKEGSRVMDLGCGGGFPGIPLAIFFPNTEFLLVDSIAKKIRVVEDISVKLGLDNLKAVHGRAESVNDEFDFVVSRAVAPMNKLWAWSRNKIRTRELNSIPNGLIALKGGDLRLELNPFGKRALVEGISTYFKEEFFETKKIVYLRK